jgi:hypothetical protein
MHQILFGDTLERTIGTLVSAAAQEGTAEAFTRAADGLRGIRILITTMGLAKEIQTDLCVRFQNEERRLREVVDDPALLEEIKRAIRDSQG